MAKCDIKSNPRPWGTFDTRIVDFLTRKEEYCVGSERPMSGHFVNHRPIPCDRPTGGSICTPKKCTKICESRILGA